MFFAEQLHIPAESAFVNDSTMALGFLILAAYYGGRLANIFSMPRITGYILIGILVGPWILKFILPEHLEKFQLIDDLALTLIAFNAGAELNINRLKKRIRSIVLIILMQTIVTVTLTTVVILLIKPFVEPFANQPIALIFGIGLIIGVISVAKSPSQTIAVIVETRSKGIMTDTVLGVTVLKDIVVIILFTLVINIVKSLTGTDTSLNISALVSLLVEIALSILSGAVYGYIIILYFRHIRQELLIFIVGIGFFITTLSHQFHLEFLLTCMVVGFVVENFSNYGNKFLEGVEKSSLPVYLVFFSIAGANLNLPILYSLWPIALVIVFSRLISIYLGTYSGARLAGDDPKICRLAWSGFIGQAGVSLGFAIIVSRQLPEIGNVVKNMIVAAIVINMIIGPIIFKWALQKSGETSAPTLRSSRKLKQVRDLKPKKV